MGLRGIQNGVNTPDNITDMVYMRGRGAHLQTIGDKYGVSRERVRQIVNLADPEGVKQAAIRETYIAEIKSNLSELISTTVKNNPSYSLTRIVKDVNASLGGMYAINEDDVCEVVPLRHFQRNHTQIYSNTWTGRTWTDEEILSALRAVYEKHFQETGYLSSVTYRRFSDGNPEVPSAALVTQRFNYWNTACEKAKIPHGQALREYVRKWTPEACLEQVVMFLQDPTVKTVGAWSFDAWSRKQGTSPSLGTVRNRLGKWSEILEAAFTQIEQGSHD